VFGGPNAVDADISSTAQLRLHTPGTSFPIRWVTIHIAKPGDTGGFSANAAAKAAGATPFKRPENMAWPPGSDFPTFFFDPTGYTDAVAGDNPFLQARGAYGAIFRVDLRDDDDDRDADVPTPTRCLRLALDLRTRALRRALVNRFGLL